MQRCLISAGVVLWAIPLLHPTLTAHLTGHDFARMCQLIVLGLMAIGTLPRRARASFQLPSLRTFLYLAALTCALLASALLATYPLVALRELLLFAGLLLLAHRLSEGVTSLTSFDLVLRSVVAGTLAHAGLVLIILGISMLDGTVVAPWEALIGFDNPRFLNHAQTAVLPLVAIVAAWDANARWRRLACITLVLSGMLLFVTFGRATLLALFIGLIAGACLFGRQAGPQVIRYALRAVALTLLGMGLMWLCYLRWLQPSGFTIDVQELTRSHYRGYLLQTAADLWARSPWVGVGPMHFAHWYNGEAAHPHNVYAQALAEYGLIGGGLIVGGALYWLARMLKTLRTAPEGTTTIAIGLTGALVGIALDAAFSGNFVMPLSQLWIALVIALAIGFRRLILVPQSGPAARTTVRTPIRVLARTGAMVLRVTLAIALAGLGTQAAITCFQTSHPTLDTAGPEGLPPGVDNSNPRFWTIGWF